MKIRIGLLIATICTPAQVLAEDVARDEWIAGMRAGIAANACADQQLFRTCFDISRQQCEETMQSATDNCVQQMGSRIPDSVEVPGQSRALGEEVGQCAGEAYGKRLAGKMLDKPECKAMTGS